MRTRDLIKMEKSGALFRVVDADKAGYMTTDNYLIEADRSVISKMYGDSNLIGFAPKGKKIILYISQK